MARMPTSSGSLMGWRASGLMGTPVRRTDALQISGPEAIERLRGAIDDASEELAVPRARCRRVGAE